MTRKTVIFLFPALLTLLTLSACTWLGDASTGVTGEMMIES